MAKNPGMPVDQEDPTGEDQVAAQKDSAANDEPGDEQPNVSPEEQDQYDVVVTAAMKVMYDEQRIQVIVQKLNAGKDNISQAIGHTASTIMQSVRSTVQAQGRAIPDDIVYAAGQEVVGQLCDIAVAAKIIKQEQVDAIANAALFEAVRAWGQSMAKNGDITPDAKNAAKKDMQDAGIKGQAPQPAQAPQSVPPTAQPQQGGIINSGAGA